MAWPTVPWARFGGVVLLGTVWVAGAVGLARPALALPPDLPEPTRSALSAPGPRMPVSLSRPPRGSPPPGKTVSQGEVDPGVALRESEGADLTVYLLTVGQGDLIWERFGHNAIWIRNEKTGEELAYNWGMFHFGQVDFIPRLIQGTMRYWMAPRDPEASLAQDRLSNRPVWVQELALTPEEKLELRTFLEWNAQPENAYYTYDYYRDNCSTRVRDALDRVLGGRIREVAQTDTTSRTYRWHTRRLLRDIPMAYVGIQWVLGPAADRPLTAWEEAFLPQRLREIVRGLDVTDGQNGLRPFVTAEWQILDSSRPPEPSKPPFRLPWFFLAGLLWGGGILALLRKGIPPGLPERWGLALMAGGWASIATLGGSLILGAWLFTDHRFWYQNLNLLQANPLFLPLAWVFLLLPFRGSIPRWARDLAAGLGVMAGVGLLVLWVPGVGQENGEILAFTLPLNAALVLAAFRLYRRPLPREKPSAPSREGGQPPGGTE